MIHVVHLTLVLKRLVRLHVRSACPCKWVDWCLQLPGTTLHLLVVEVVSGTHRAFLYWLIRLGCRAIHIEILTSVRLLLVHSLCLGHHWYVLGWIDHAVGGRPWRGVLHELAVVGVIDQLNWLLLLSIEVHIWLGDSPWWELTIFKSACIRMGIERHLIILRWSN